MADIGSLNATVSADATEFITALQNATDRLDDFSTRLQDVSSKSGDTNSAMDRTASSGLNLGAVFQQIGVIASAIGLEKVAEDIMQIGMEALHTAQSLEFMGKNLDRITGSSKNTAELFEKIKDLSDKGIFPHEDVLKFADNLAIMGVKTEKIPDLLHAMAGATVGSSNSLAEADQKMNMLVTQLGYLNDRGSITVSGLQRLEKSLHIPIIDVLREQMQKTATAHDVLQKGTKMTADQTAIMTDSLNKAKDTLSDLEKNGKKASETQNDYNLKVQSAKDHIQQYSDKLGNANKIIRVTPDYIHMSADEFAKQKVTMDMVTAALQAATSGTGRFANSLEDASTTTEARTQALHEQFEGLALSVIGISDTGRIVKEGFFDKFTTGLSAVGEFLKANSPTFIAFFNNLMAWFKTLSFQLMTLKPMWDVLIKDLQELWTKIGPQLGPALSEFGSILRDVIVVAVGMVIVVITVAVQVFGWLYEANKKVYDFMQGSVIPQWGIFAGAVSDTVKVIRLNFGDFVKWFGDQLKQLFSWLDDLAKKAQAALSFLNPKVPHSPALVDEVASGMKMIRDQFEMTANLKIQAPSFTPPPVSAFSQNYSYAYNNAPTQNQSINNTFIVGSQQQANNIAEFLGFQLEHRGIV